MPGLVAWVITWGSDEGDGILHCCPEQGSICWRGWARLFAYLLRSGLWAGERERVRRWQDS